MKDKRRCVKMAIFAVILLFGILTCINPIYPSEQFLQHLGTLILLIILFIDLRRNNLTTFAYVLFALFIVVHIIGARYIYSYVPYDRWINGFFNFINIESVRYSPERNAYDRFVHFAFGIFVFPIIFEYLNHQENSRKGKVIILTWSIIQTISMMYELFEWCLTLVLSTEAANDYNGQQGDLWDAQKDMFLALIGSTIIALIYFYKIRKNCGNKGDQIANDI